MAAKLYMGKLQKKMVLTTISKHDKPIKKTLKRQRALLKLRQPPPDALNPRDVPGKT